RDAFVAERFCGWQCPKCQTMASQASPARAAVGPLASSSAEEAVAAASAGMAVVAETTAALKTALGAGGGVGNDRDAATDTPTGGEPLSQGSVVSAMMATEELVPVAEAELEEFVASVPTSPERGATLKGIHGGEYVGPEDGAGESDVPLSESPSDHVPSSPPLALDKLKTPPRAKTNLGNEGQVG
ncbi:unnamed protein product, partial [Choristocarpus tenellus]